MPDDIFAPTASEIEHIPLGEEAGVAERTRIHAHSKITDAWRKLVTHEIGTFAEFAAARSNDPDVLDRLRYPSRVFLRAAALFQRAAPDEFEGVFSKLSAIPHVEHFKPERLRSAIARIDKKLDSLEEEIRKEWAANEPDDIKRERRQKKEMQATAHCKVIALGFCGDSFYYQSNQSNDIVCLTPREHGVNQYLRMAPKLYWEENFSEPDGYGGFKALNWLDVTSTLMAEARARGPIDPNNIRGRGAWIDKNEIAYNTGADILFEDGSRIPLLDGGSDGRLYAPGPKIEVADEELSQSERARLIEIIGTFRFEKNAHRLMVIGWMLMSTIAGALSFRCLMWITALAGSGKTTFFKLIGTLLGAAAHKLRGSTTVLGIADVVRFDSVVFLLDEAEVDTEAAAARMQKMLTELRGTVTATDAVRAVAKKTLRLESTGCISSINANFTQTADLTRILPPKLLPLDRSTEEARAQGAAAKKLIEETITSQLSARFLAFGIFNFTKIRETIAAFVDYFLQIFESDRLAEHWGTAFGCAYFFENARVPTRDEIAAWCRANEVVEDEILTDDARKSESDQVFEFLLGHRLKVVDAQNLERPIGELMAAAIRPGAAGIRIDRKTAIETLDHHGIYVDVANARIRIARSLLSIRNIFARSAFGNNFVDALEKLVDADDKPFAGARNFRRAGVSRCVPIKIAKLISLLGLDEPVADALASPAASADAQLADDTLKAIFVARVPAPNLEGREIRERVRDLYDTALGVMSYPFVEKGNAKHALESVGISCVRNPITGEWTKEMLVAVGHPRLRELLGAGGNALGRNYEEVLRPLVVETHADVDFAGVRYPALQIRDL